MSYCRWSSADFKCDLYVYEARDGVSINVASHRIVEDAPTIVWSEGPDVLYSTYRKQMSFMETAERKPIGGPYDGASWSGLTHEEAAKVVKMLGEAGYIFPDTLLEDLLEEHRKRIEAFLEG